VFFIKTLLIILAAVITLGIVLTESNEDQLVIPDNSLRLRIIPSSNSSEDVEIKLIIKEIIEEAIQRLLNNVWTLEESKQIIEKNIENLDNKISEVLNPLNKRYHINFGQNHFPSKVFRGVFYKAGEYDSLVITIEDGDGDNWWCVLFPPLCSLEKNDNLGEIEYQLFVSRIINQFRQYT